MAKIVGDGATILLRVESGSSKAPPDSMPHNDQPAIDTVRNVQIAFPSIPKTLADARMVPLSGHPPTIASESFGIAGDDLYAFYSTSLLPAESLFGMESGGALLEPFYPKQDGRPHLPRSSPSS